MAKFQPGQSGNPKGRERGTTNKTTEQFREMVKRFVQDNWDSLQGDFDKMKPGERALFRERLLKYFLPEAMNPEKLTEEQLQQIIEYLKNNTMKKLGTNKQALKN